MAHENAEHARRLREVNTAMTGGTPLVFSEAHAAALEAGAVALEATLSTRRGPIDDDDSDTK